jgi:hypothetical protein
MCVIARGSNLRPSQFGSVSYRRDENVDDDICAL